MAISFNGSYGANSTDRDGSSLSVTFTPAVGERIVVKLVVETGGLPRTVPTSNNGLTWTLKQTADYGSAYSACYVWESSTVTSATSTTVTCHGTGGSARVMSMIAERWSGARVGTTVHASNGTSSAPSGTLTATVGSYISTVIADYNSGDTTTRAYLSGATEEFIASQLQTFYLSAYHIYQAVSSTGTQTVGMSAPSNQKWTMAAVEMIEPSNGAPTANAGPDHSNVEPWATVTLQGSGTDSDGSIASYAWTQTGGTTVTLSSSTVASPTFAAPAVVNGATLIFSLMVTDNLGLQSTADTVTITVLPATTFYASGSSWQAMRVTEL